MLRLVRAWTLATLAGEVLGFGLVGVLAYPLLVVPAVEPSPARLALFALLAGLLEGGCLGLAQGLVLRRAFPGLGPRQWVPATALPAVVAYVIGMTFFPLVGEAALPLPATLVLSALVAIALALTLGVGQWLVLRRRAPMAWTWIVVSAAAWAFAVLLAIGAVALVPDGAPPWAWILSGVAGGLAMGLTVGLATGLVLQRLARAG